MRLRDAMERVVRGELAPPPVATLLGISLASFKDGEAVVTLAAGDSHTNPMGTVQGGVLAALADGAMGWARDEDQLPAPGVEGHADGDRAD